MSDSERRELDEELREAADWLTAEGQLERDVLAEAEGLQDAPGMDRVRAFRPPIGREEPKATRRPGTGPRLRWLAAAVAATIVAFILGQTWTSRRPASPEDFPGGEILLGEGELGNLHPAGEGADFSEFRWQYTLTAGEYFELLILDDSSPEADTTLERRSHLESNTWRPDPEQLDNWPASIRWEVRVLSPDGGIKLSEEQSASRSSR